MTYGSFVPISFSSPKMRQMEFDEIIFIYDRTLQDEVSFNAELGRGFFILCKVTRFLLANKNL